MKPVIRSCLAWLLLAATGLAHASSENDAPDSRVPLPEPSVQLVAQPVEAGAEEMARYAERQRELPKATEDKEAGAGMDRTTVIVLVVLAVAVIALAAGSGGGGGGY